MCREWANAFRYITLIKTTVTMRKEQIAKTVTFVQGGDSSEATSTEENFDVLAALIGADHEMIAPSGE